MDEDAVMVLDTGADDEPAGEEVGCDVLEGPDGTKGTPVGEELGCCRLADAADVDKLPEDGDMEEGSGEELDCCALDDTAGTDELLAEDAELDVAGVELDCVAPDDTTGADRVLAEGALVEGTDTEEPPAEAKKKELAWEEAEFGVDTADEVEALRGEETGTEDAGTETKLVEIAEGSETDEATDELDVLGIVVIGEEAGDELAADIFEIAEDDT